MKRIDRRRLVHVAVGLVSMWMLSGCLDTPDVHGWKPSQKEALLRFVKEDKYLSLCDAKPLYEQARKTQDGALMDALLVRYAENLANGCIDIETFQRRQRARKHENFKTHYEIYRQPVPKEQLLAQAKSGVPIEKILEPYVPKYREFARLVHAYRTYKQAQAPEALLHKIRLNVERVKLLKPLKGDRYVLINIPQFQVYLVEKGTTKVTMRIVVGKRHMQTPIFGQNLQYIVLNPPWNVPESIMRKEIIPKIIKNPNYLKSHGMEAHVNYNLTSPEVDLASYDLQSYTKKTSSEEGMPARYKPLPFRIVQVPSKRNGLGRVKFLFPNKHSVYMHDTQSKYLFKRKYRAYSHGCIRLAKPYDMLRYLVRHYTATPWEEAKAMYDSLKTHYIRVTKPLPVHTAYLTVYVDDEGNLLQFDDIYGYDRIQPLRM